VLSNALKEDLQQLASGNSTHGKPEVPITPDYVNLFTGPATGEGSWTFLGESLGIWPSKYRERYGTNGYFTSVFSKNISHWMIL
jgi:hypothetical protein